MQHLDSLNTSSVTTHQQAQYRKSQAFWPANSSTSSPYNVQHDQHNSTINTSTDLYQRLTVRASEASDRTHQTDSIPQFQDDKQRGGESDFDVSKEAANVRTITSNSSLSSAKAKSSASSYPSAPLMSTAQDSDQHEIQTKHILNHVNELLRFCQLQQSKHVTSIRQCTSSLFVLLYQRLFGCAIANIESFPNTPEKKRRNVTLVLEELRKRSYALADISVEQVVKLNEDHVSRLIMVFVSIADDMKYQQQRTAAAEVLERTPMPQAHPGYTVAEVAPPGVTVAPIVYTTGAPATAAGLEFNLNQAAPLGRAFPEASPHLVDNDVECPMPARYLNQNLPPDAISRYPLPYPAHEALEGKERGERGDYGIQEEIPSSSYEDIDSAKAGPLPYVSASPISKEKLVETWSREIVSPRVDPADSPNNFYFPMRTSGGRLLSSSTATPLRLNTSDIRQRFRKLSDAVHEPALRRPTPGDTTAPTALTPSSTAVGTNSAEASPVPLIAGVGQRLSSHSKQKKTYPQASPATTTRPTPLHTSSAKKRNPARQLPHHAGLSSPNRVGSSRPNTIELSSLPPDEPPLTPAECRLLASHPYSLYSGKDRDRKIERLRASRFLNEMQSRLHQGIRRDYESRMAEMRQSLKRNISASRRNMLDGMRWIRDENNKYRDAYTTVMEAAANDSRMAQRMMSDYTAKLAKHYSDSLHESQRMSAYLEDEKERQDMMNLVQYAQIVTSWQQQLAV
ncbi:unnamed protein product [Phytomonas sp. EM1]|nr:unnamed protein product [Phytomonas sp. EM1]|eukprot:CCW62935.1 unnamed protein product [Phytomonas sp. isolate EM1]